MTDQPQKVELATPDIAAANRESLKALIPGVIADGVLDAARLGELLDIPVTSTAEGRERFGLMWAGKQEAVRSLLTPSRGTLIPDVERSVDFDTAQNVFIEGDNLEVLKLLQKAYNDKVKLIYIDPPYNTGNDFVYNDDFSDGLRGYLEYTGQLDDDGNRTSASADTSGRRHSKWLSMMYPRLVLARNLLRQDGVFAVSIDDNEAANLRSVLDEVFGAENFLNAFVWVSNLKGRQISGTGAAGTKEYVLVYARDAKQLEGFRASASRLKSWMPTVYKGFNYETQTDERGPYVLKNELYNTNSAFNEVTRPNLVFDIYFDPPTGAVKTAELSPEHLFEGYVKISPKKNNNGTNRYHAFRWSRAKVEAETYDLAFVPAKGGGYKVFTKVRDVDSTSVKDLVMDISTNEGAADLESVGIDEHWFDYPKPVKLVQLLISFATEEDSLVLDFFAGSGTTGHAVAAQNAADGGRRQYLLINLPEATTTDSDARAAGLDTVSEICRRRLRGVLDHVPGAGSVGLRTVALGASAFRQPAKGDESLFDLSESTLMPSTPDLDRVAAEVLLKEGVALDAAWERRVARTAPVVVAGGVAVVLTVDLDDGVIDAAFDLKPPVVVFLEDGFAGKDAAKTNAFSRARELGITMKTV